MTEPPPAECYYAQRAEQERRAADRCEDPAARRIHRELADRYEMLTADDTSLTA